MSTILSPDQLELLLPALRYLAETVQKNGLPNRDDLQLLLLASDMEDDWAVSELLRWAKVLAAIRGTNDPGKRAVAQQALMLRGIPEASAMLAISSVAGAESQKPKLIASVAQVDFGTLSPGQRVSREFEVQGGPGRIFVESDQLLVTPQQFGAGPMHIRVEVKPLVGELLWTPLRLVTAGETLEIPVLAQVESQSLEPETLPAGESPSPFLFEGGRKAYSVEDLVHVCEQLPTEAIEHLMKGHFEPWLTDIGRDDLAKQARKARRTPGYKEARLKKFLDATGVQHKYRVPVTQAKQPGGKTGRVRQTYHAQPFLFEGSRQAYTVEDLVHVCEQLPTEAIGHLMKGHFEQWLTDIGRDDLAKQARKARRTPGYKEARLKKFLDATGVQHKYRVPITESITQTKAKQSGERTKRARQTYHAQQKMSGQAFFIMWVIINVLSYAVGFFAIYQIDLPTLLEGVVLGAVVGVGQYLLLRRLIRRAGLWALASVIGWGVGAALAETSGSAILIGATAGAVSGFMQWLLLRQQVQASGWWFPVNTIGLAIGFTGYHYIMLMTDVNIIKGGAIMGVVTAIITGFPLVWLLRSPT